PTRRNTATYVSVCSPGHASSKIRSRSSIFRATAVAQTSPGAPCLRKWSLLFNPTSSVPFTTTPIFRSKSECSQDQ
ncbi:unnamed protein product, partial [Pylaiella littoralis]